jgi:hypothetical protein
VKKTKKNRIKNGGENKDMPITKEENIVTFSTYPSALYGNKSIKSQVNVDKTFPSLQENLKYQVDSVEEMLGSLKLDKKPPVHREILVLERAYK